MGHKRKKKEETDPEFLTRVFKIYGNVFYGRKARDYTAEVLNSCYDFMICTERDFYHLDIVNIY